jgi:1-acyl-sn-glycerol-3-phosphate acyltransferase
MRYARALLRFVLFIVSTFGLYAIWFVGSFVIPNKQFWRQLAFHYWTTSFVKIAGMTIEIIGQPPQPPFFLVTNHLSYTDIAVLRAIVPGVFVAKAEIKGWFLAGRIVADMGNIFIDRKSKRDIPRAGAEIIKKLNEGEGVIVFPEGTSSKGEEVLPFNSSFLQFAAKTDIPVSYASISYRTPKGEPTASEMVCWWEDISFISHLFRLFTLKKFTATVTFGEEPVLNPDRKVLANELRQKVAARFIPVI